MTYEKILSAIYSCEVSNYCWFSSYIWRTPIH